MKKTENTIPLPESKSNEKALREYFSKILPEYDEERVHVSDMKKMVRWYGILKQHELIPDEETPATAGAAESEAES
jgi:hypothetical protein